MLGFERLLCCVVMVSAPIVLIVAAFITSIISAILGMGGGILLLAVMFCFLSHGEAIPLHAAVQLVSNSTRVLAFLGNVDWKTVGRFAVGAVPGGVAGGVLLSLLGSPEQSEPYLKITIGVYILAMTLIPARKRKPSERRRASTWIALGFLVGTLGITVGAVGPLIAPHFARQGFAKERLIATKAVCQIIAHTIKLPVFWILRDLQMAEFSLLLGAMVAVVIPGTLLGRYLLRYVSEQWFRYLYRAALLVAGLKVLIFDGLRKVIMP